MTYTHTTFSEADIRSFEPAMKIGLLATVNPQGQPHLSLITTLKAASDRQVVWGQFTEGLSKEYVRQNPRTGWRAYRDVASACLRLADHVPGPARLAR